jgi:serpin B
MSIIANSQEGLYQLKNHATYTIFDTSSVKSTIFMTMNNTLLRITLILAVLAVMAACEVKETVNTDETGQIELRKKSAEIIEADQQFAFELFNKVCSMSDNENIMISPLSVSYALGMALNGANGTTLEEFFSVLHLEELTNQEVNESYKDLMGQLVRLDPEVQFSIANSIWYKLGFQVLEEFITTNQEYFDAAVRELDFYDPEAVEIINSWIEEKTNDKIQDMLDAIPPDAVMYLINAVYFNARWKYQFDKEDTYPGNFNLSGGGTHEAEFMKMRGTFNYTVNDDFRAVELPYGDSSFSMVVILPREEADLDTLIGEMNAERWDGWFSFPNITEIDIELPKFKYGWKDLLNVPLQNLGLQEAFSEGADFSRIRASGGIFISRVIHQSFIDVQEEGTEAAAATIIEFRETSIPSTPYFRADRPFLYVIKENSTGAILFMGKVGKPEYEEE